MSLNQAKIALVLFWIGSNCVRAHGQVHSLGYDTPAFIDFEFSEVTVSEGQPAAIINVYRTGDFRQYTRVDYATEDGSATENSDYRATGGTLTFQPGEGMKQIAVPLIADSEPEPNETFKVVLTNPSVTAVILRNSITVTIHDAPGPISAPKLQISSSHPGEITLSWDGDPGYVLERTTQAAATGWEAVSTAPTVTGTHCEVTESAGAALYLYRLRSP